MGYAGMGEWIGGAINRVGNDLNGIRMHDTINKGYNRGMATLGSQYKASQDYLSDALSRMQDYMQPYTTMGKTATTNLASLEADPNSIKNMPGYLFRLDEGTRLISQQKAAQGKYFSGETLRAIEEFGQNYASSEYGAEFNRQRDLATLGQGASSLVTSESNKLGQAQAGTATTYGEDIASMQANKARDSVSAMASTNANFMTANNTIGAGVDKQLGSSGGGGGMSGGDMGGGGSIICTAMNEAYGFGEFRNRIWVKFGTKYLTEDHRIGYHQLFLKPVRYGFKSGDSVPKLIVRKILEHIARHRTIDIRAVMHNEKRDPIGMIYRALLEPLCRVVGILVRKKIIAKTKG